MSGETGYHFLCPGCGASFGWKPQFAGRRIRCKCGQVFVPPDPNAALAASQAEPDPYDVSGDRRYSEVEVPRTESLKDTIARALPYYDAEIVPALKAGKRVLVAAHGNSLRGIVKYLSNIGDQEIVRVEIPTGKPIVYELSADLTVGKKYDLA